MSKYAISISGVEGETYMARARSPERDKAFEIWKEHKGEITNRKIAEQLNVDEKKVAVWKSRDKWNVVQQSTTNDVQQTTKKAKNPLIGNQRAKGNRGNPNPQNQFTNRNTASKKHGLFAKYIPQETLDIMESMEDQSPADLIWEQIQIQYAAIIRAQQIMFVANKNDLTKELKREKHSSGETGSSWEEEYEIQFAWDKQASYMNAQSRAMSELRNLIKHFNEMTYDDDERKLKLQQMQVGIEKTKVEIEKISNGGNDDGPIEIVIRSKKAD